MSRTRTSEYECRNASCERSGNEDREASPWIVDEEDAGAYDWMPVVFNSWLCPGCGVEGTWRR